MTKHHRNRAGYGISVVLLCASLGAVGLAHAAADAVPVDETRGVQTLISQAPGGAFPNAPTQEPVISHDDRTAVAIAYTSAATNIVAQNTGDRRNVYLVKRQKPYDAEANQAWAVGSTELVSSGGESPNGDSWGATLSGDDNYGAKCIAFLSNASNLVTGDRNNKTDIFLRSVAGGKLKRIEGKGAINKVDVDGGCKRIAYSSSAGVFVNAVGGRSTRVFGRSASNVSLSTYGTAASFERGGAVHTWKRGQRAKRVAPGTESQIVGNGKSVLFNNVATIYQYNLGTGVSTVIGPGSQPTATLTGVFVFWINGLLVDATGLRSAGAGCATGAQRPDTSGHGNYLIYLCDRSGGPQLYLSYIGSKSLGHR